MDVSSWWIVRGWCFSYAKAIVPEVHNLLGFKRKPVSLRIVHCTDGQSIVHCTFRIIPHCQCLCSLDNVRLIISTSETHAIEEKQILADRLPLYNVDLYRTYSSAVDCYVVS